MVKKARNCHNCHKLSNVLKMVKLPKINKNAINIQKFQKSSKIQKMVRNVRNDQGTSLTKEESDIADLIDEAYKQRITNAHDIRTFISGNTYKNKSETLIRTVINKLQNTYEILVLENSPFVSQEDYDHLLQYQKPTKQRRN